LGFLASAFLACVTVVAAIVPAFRPTGRPGDRPSFPAPEGYLLPWAGGELHTVTQGEETPFTHNGLAAYAFDFDLNYETVVAARGGRVTMVRSDSNLGGCSPFFSSWTNYVAIDHGDGTTGLYLHLAYNSVSVKPGDIVAQGDPIAISGETGVTCSGDGYNPGPHLHFQVQRTDPSHYFTQSLPIAFDDISANAGVPQQDATYMSGNYGRGKEQKIKLTPHRVPREFNPRAVPLNPAFFEAPKPPATPSSSAPAKSLLDADTTAGLAALATATAAANEPPPLIERLLELTPTETATETPTETPTPEPSATPAPSATPVPPSPVPPTPVPSPPPSATTEPATPIAQASPLPSNTAVSSPTP